MYMHGISTNLVIHDHSFILWKFRRPKHIFIKNGLYPLYTDHRYLFQSNILKVWPLQVYKYVTLPDKEIVRHFVIAINSI